MVTLASCKSSRSDDIVPPIIMAGEGAGIAANAADAPKLSPSKVPSMAEAYLCDMIFSVS